LLATIGLPGGGVVRVGTTHVRVTPGEMARLNELEVPQDAFDNGAGAPGDAVAVERAVVPEATSTRVLLAGAPIDAVPSELVGVPVTKGERYRTANGTVDIVEVVPAPTAIVTTSTLARAPIRNDASDTVRTNRTSTPERSVLTAGLDNEYELLTGWLELLMGDRPGTPRQRVAGIVVSGPPGCGKGELVAAASSDLSYQMTTIDLRTVTTPDRLLSRFERAIKGAQPRTVLYVKRLDHLIDRDGGVRYQAAAVTRWLLDTAADTSGVTVVIGTRLSDLPETLDARELLPRTLTIAPPDRDRRRALFASALDETTEIDLDRLANATPGFSALDISSAVLAARASAPRAPTTGDVLDAIGATTPSLGTATLGDIPSYGFDKVANLTDVKRTLTETVIWQLREPERFERMGIEPPRGLLLYGPPGTGKTYVMRALAHESGAAFFSVKGAELLDKWVGESERGVREVFARARALAPAIVFLDELDALAPQRGRSTNTVTDSVVAALLTELDGVGARGDVFVVGATNRRDLIDPALLRPGRLEVHLFLDVPEPAARAAFFSMTSVPFDGEVDLDELVERTDGFSFADLDGVLRSAAILSLRSDASASAVSMGELRAAITDRLAQRPNRRGD
jgi:transitional endoplasmic reticulum ATPase